MPSHIHSKTLSIPRNVPEMMAADDGVGDQGVRGQDAGQEERCRHIEGQQPYTRHEPEDEWYGNGEQSEDDAVTDVLLEAFEVHLESGEEHDVVDAHLAEEFETAVAGEDVESVLADDGTREDESDEVGDMQSCEDDGGEQDNAQHDEENPSRVSDWQKRQYLINQVHTRSLRSVVGRFVH